MTVNLEERPLSEQIKFLTAYRGYNLKTLGEEFNRRFGTRYVQQSFSRKINNQAFDWVDLNRLGDILGFKVKLELVDKAPQVPTQ